VSEVVATSGWCAPAPIYWEPGIRPETWPPGLLPEDLAWLARMLEGTEVDLREGDPLDLPAISVRRGGLRF
jgi:hypothetical protein